MTITAVATDPQYPTAAVEVTLSATSDTYPDEDVEFVLTSVPDESALELGRLMVNGTIVNTFTPDAPGEYGFQALEYHNTEPSGAYASDPLSQARHDLKSVYAATINVGTTLDLPIVPVNGHSSTLRITVVGDHVRAAALVEPATDLARMAALDTTVAAAVSALVGVLVTGIDVDFDEDVNDLCEKFTDHIILTTGSVHFEADLTNTLIREPAYATASGINRLNELSSKFAGHREATLTGGDWHDSDDNKDVLAVAPFATTLAEAIVLKADLRERGYERHRVLTANPDSHGNPDNTNAMPNPLPLPVAIVAYLDFISNNAPDIPAGEGEGIGDAQAAWGFRT